MNEHLQFVLDHDGLLPEKGFGGCNCGDCEKLRTYIGFKLDICVCKEDFTDGTAICQQCLKGRR